MFKPPDFGQSDSIDFITLGRKSFEAYRRDNAKLSHHNIFFTFVFTSSSFSVCPFILIVIGHWNDCENWISQYLHFWIFSNFFLSPLSLSPFLSTLHSNHLYHVHIYRNYFRFCFALLFICVAECLRRNGFMVSLSFFFWFFSATGLFQCTQNIKTKNLTGKYYWQ